MRIAPIAGISLTGAFVVVAMGSVSACSLNGGGGASSSDDSSGTSGSPSSSTTGGAGSSATGGVGSTTASEGVGSTSTGSTGSARTSDSHLDGGSHGDASVPEDASVLDATASGDSSDLLAAARQLCVQIINQDRASLATPSPALTENTAEEPCVDEQAQADYEAGTAHHAFGNCKESAQDECPNWPGTPSEIMTKCLAQMWAEGPPAAGQDNHWLNMSNAKYTKVACGFYQTPSGSWWATQDFWVK